MSFMKSARRKKDLGITGFMAKWYDRNSREPLKALNEMCRVLKTGGTALIIDMNHDTTREAQDAELARMNAGGFDRLFVRFAFRTFLRKGAYTKEALSGLLRQSDFKDHEIKEIGMGLYAYCRKA